MTQRKQEPSEAKRRTDDLPDGSLFWRRTPWPLVAVASVLAVVTYPVRSALVFGALCAGLAWGLR